jgi:hypothetical protein
MHQKPTRSVRGNRHAIHHSTTAKADPAIEAALAEQKQAILALFAQGEAAHWKIGQRYNKIVREQLAEKAGYEHARDFFAAEVKAIPQATLSGYGRVAKTFSEEIAGRYGMTKLNLLLVLRKLTQAGPVEGDHGPIEIDVPGKDGSTQRKRFADVTARELARTIRRLKGPPPADPQLPPLEKRIMDAMSRTVADFYGPKFNIGFKVQARGGKAYFSLENVPLEVMDALFNSLFSAEWNEREREESTPRPAPQATRQPLSKRLEAARAPAAKVEHRRASSHQASGTKASTRRSPSRPPAGSVPSAWNGSGRRHPVPPPPEVGRRRGSNRLERKAAPVERRGPAKAPARSQRFPSRGKISRSWVATASRRPATRRT